MLKVDHRTIHWTWKMLEIKPAYLFAVMPSQSEKNDSDVMYDFNVDKC